MSGLEKLKAECDEVRTLIPQTSASSDEDHGLHETNLNHVNHTKELEEEFCSPSPLSSSTNTSPLHSSSAHSVSYSPDLSSPSESVCSTPLLTDRQEGESGTSVLTDRQTDTSCHSTPKSSPKRDRLSENISESVLTNGMCDAKNNHDAISENFFENCRKDDSTSVKKKRLGEGESFEKEDLLSNGDIEESNSSYRPNILVSDVIEIVDTDYSVDQVKSDATENLSVLDERSNGKSLFQNKKFRLRIKQCHVVDRRKCVKLKTYTQCNSVAHYAIVG